MKYNVTPDLIETKDSNGQNNIDFMDGQIASGIPTTEYFPPALVVEACQTLDGNGNIPSSQADVKRVLSRKMRLYSLPLPKIQSSTNVKKIGTYTVTNNATLRAIDVESERVRTATNITSTIVKTNELVIPDITTEVINTKNLSATEISAILGIIDDLNGTSVNYTYAEIQDLIAQNEISSESAMFDYLNIDDTISAKTAVLEYRNIDQNKTDISLVLDNIETNCQNISELYRYGTDPQVDSIVQPEPSDASQFSGTVVDILGRYANDGDISKQYLYINNAYNTAIGCASENNSIMERYNSLDPRDISAIQTRVFPITPFGRVKVKVKGTLNKFDRIEYDATDFIAKKRTSGKAIGIALEKKTTNGNGLVECLVLFNIL